MSLEDVVRPALPPQRAPGFRPPASRGINQDTPAVSFGEDSAPTTTGPYLRDDQINDFARFPALNGVFAGDQGVASAWKDVSGSVELDLNKCNSWRLRAQSASLAITFADLDALPAALDGTLWEGAVREVVAKIVIEWQSAASGSRTLTLSGVRFDDGAAPDWSTDALSRDILQIYMNSDGEKYGFAPALDTRVP